MPTIIRRKGLGMSSAKGIAEQSKTGIRWVRSDTVPLPEDDLYIRWGCTANVPTRNILNSARSIHQVNDKGGFRQILSDAKLSPKMWFDYQRVPHNFIMKGVVVRPNKHAQGKHVYLCHNGRELIQAVRRCGIGYYISEFINKVAEYRVAIIQGRVAWVAQKTPGNPHEVAWNVAKGGRFDNVRWNDWPLGAVLASVGAFDLTTLDFGGVDVMVDAEGVAHILEINSAPSLTSPYRQLCFAKCFDYIIMSGSKKRIPVVRGGDNYLDFIHPAIEMNAKV